MYVNKCWSCQISSRMFFVWHAKRFVAKTSRPNKVWEQIYLLLRENVVEFFSSFLFACFAVYYACCFSRYERTYLQIYIAPKIATRCVSQNLANCCISAKFQIRTGPDQTRQSPRTCRRPARTHKLTVGEFVNHINKLATCCGEIS